MALILIETPDQARIRKRRRVKLVAELALIIAWIWIIIMAVKAI